MYSLEYEKKLSDDLYGQYQKNILEAISKIESSIKRSP
jgi:hypothetical protein